MSEWTLLWILTAVAALQVAAIAHHCIVLMLLEERDVGQRICAETVPARKP